MKAQLGPSFFRGDKRFGPIRDVVATAPKFRNLAKTPNAATCANAVDTFKKVYLAGEA